MHPVVKACPARRGWGLDCLSSAVNPTGQMEKSPPLAVPQCFERHSALLRDTVHGAAAAYSTAIVQILEVAAGLHDVSEGFRIWWLNLELGIHQQRQDRSCFLPLLICMVLELIPEVTTDARQAANFRLRRATRAVKPAGAAEVGG